MKENTTKTPMSTHIR